MKLLNFEEFSSLNEAAKTIKDAIIVMLNDKADGDNLALDDLLSKLVRQEAKKITKEDLDESVDMDLLEAIQNDAKVTMKY